MTGNKNMTKRLGGAAVLALMLLTGQGAVAATQGTLGTTSTGTVGVSLTINPVYQVTSLTDFVLGTYGGTGAMTGNQDVCVYTNDATRSYGVRVTDSSTMSATGFSVQNAGATAQIPYTLRWNDATGIAGNTALAYNTRLASIDANITSATCATGGDSANLQISLLATDLQAAPAGSYTTTVSVLIEP